VNNEAKTLYSQKIGRGKLAVRKLWSANFPVFSITYINQGAQHISTAELVAAEKDVNKCEFVLCRCIIKLRAGGG
jgi:hypothetical protein